MSITREQVLSYGVSGATGSAGLIAKAANEAAKASVEGEDRIGWATQFVVDASHWSAMEQLTALCMFLGAVGVLVRIYVDVSAHRDRKRAQKAECES